MLIFVKSHDELVNLGIELIKAKLYWNSELHLYISSKDVDNNVFFVVEKLLMKKWCKAYTVNNISTLEFIELRYMLIGVMKVEYKTLLKLKLKYEFIPLHEQK